MHRPILALAAAMSLAGCMTPDMVSTASTSKLIDVACINPAFTPQATIDAARWELERRNVDCRAIAMQALMIRAANPLPIPAPHQPYMMQPGPAYQPYPTTQNQPTAFGTLIGYRNSTTATGMPAYVCQYRVGNSVRETTQAVSQGPCAPTANLY